MSQEVLKGLDDHNEKNLAVLPYENLKKLNWLDELDLYIQVQAYAQISNKDGLPSFDFVDPVLPLASYIDYWVHALDRPILRPDHQFSFQSLPIHIKAYARVGLMGNPSDGFYGKTKAKQNKKVSYTHTHHF